MFDDIKKRIENNQWTGLDEQLAQLAQADQKNPDWPHLQAILANARNDIKTAQVHFTQAIANAPEQTVIIANYIITYAQRKDWQTAMNLLTSYAKSKDQFTDHAQSFAYIAKEANNLEEAESWSEVLKQHHGENIDVWILKSKIARQQNNLHQAYIYCLKGIRVAPANIDLWEYFSQLLIQMKDYNFATMAIAHTISIDPQNTNILYTKANLLTQQQNLKKASKTYEKILQISPNDHPARWNKSITNLQRGNWKDGWIDYEIRWNLELFKQSLRAFKLPEWKGVADASKQSHQTQEQGITTSYESIHCANTRLLIYHEQGIGDQVLFSRLFSLLPKFDKLVMSFDERLQDLMQRSFPDVTIITREQEEKCIALEKLTHQCALASLPLKLGIDQPIQHGNPLLMKSSLVTEQYLTQKLRRKWQKKANKRHIIGLSWAARSAQWNSEQRSLKLEQLLSILSRKDCIFIDLQYGPTIDWIQEFYNEYAIQIEQDFEIDNLNDLDGFASLIQAMDAVISIGNSTCHFAGALGQHCWALIPTPDHLWHRALNDQFMNWYPYVHIHRQHTDGSWTKALQQINKAIDTHLKH